MPDTPKWHEPVCLAITEPILWLGVPREWCIAEMLALMYLCWYAHYWLVAPILVMLHVIAVWWTRKDPDFVAVIMEHLRLTGYYEV